MSQFARCPHTFRPLDPGATVSPYTGLELPADWSESVTHCIAMAGARASGKSLYTAVVIKQLELLAARFHRLIRPLDESTRERYTTHYETPLYLEMRHMAPTPTSTSTDAYQRDPLIFTLGTWRAPDGVDRVHNLVLRDVAGEDLENTETPVEELEFFRHAHLIVFLFDPLKVPQISSYLHGLIPPQASLGGNPEDVLENLRRILGDARPALAVTISKFDTLQKLAALPDGEWQAIMGNEGSSFRRDTGWDFDRHDQLMLDMEIDALLRYVKADTLLNQLEEAYGSRGERHYFAVSALGESPTGEHLSRQGIAPFRTTDPLRWHLQRYGVFEEPQPGGVSL
ncbi:MAG: hypothetical protein GX859_01180 [Corynebacterium humireducens]|jgi:hypothetical protein|uniref:Uncharacterized protein n=2 Tax=Corynebacterium humireducens TaxID=1223514 RepID=A0A0B5DC71_9CORY|nr:hypothetical protein [Corynebacterium humireducens]AJE33753.1 hypothetical protein B842_09520 [Corynebacterium humireducens NBRC 106098 = DSM 45392]NLA54903.1 hypothetical protein [Corynebacterium humireducens]